MDNELLRLLSKINPTQRKVIEDLIKSKDEAKARDRFDLNSILFDKQLEVINNPSKRWCVVCSRRSGKSTMISAYLLKYALENKRTLSLYIGLTKASARNAVWDILLSMIEDYNLPCKPNHHTLHIDFDNGSRLLIEGAKDKVACERLRGMKLSNCVLDEAQGFPPMFAHSLVAEIIAPALGDLNGRFILAGTPDPLCNSVLYKAWVGEPPFGGFSKFHWNVTHNVKFPRFSSVTPEEYLDIVCKETGYKRDDPGFRREYLGEFVKDESGLVYGFDPSRDYCDDLPAVSDFRYVISCDAGFVDSDAIVVTAYSPSHPTAYVVDCYSNDKQDISSFMNAIMSFKEKYNPSTVIIDPGGGGLKIVEELNNRFKIGAKAAQKYNPKSLGAAIVAAEFRSQRLKIVHNEDTELLGLQLSNIMWRIKTNSRTGAEERYIPDGHTIKGKGNQIISDDATDCLLYSIKYLKTYNFKTALKEPNQMELILTEMQSHKKRLSQEFLERQEGIDLFSTTPDWY